MNINNELALFNAEWLNNGVNKTFYFLNVSHRDIVVVRRPHV